MILAAVIGVMMGRDHHFVAFVHAVSPPRTTPYDIARLGPGGTTIMVPGDSKSPDAGPDEIGTHHKPIMHMLEESDAAQASRWASDLAGDDENTAALAFSQIYNRYWRPLIAFGARYCSLSIADAKDIAQDLFTHVWATRRKWSVHSSVYRYLLRAMENRALKKHRYERRRARREETITAATGAVVMNDAIYEIEEREFSTAVLDILDRLPSRERDVLRMRKYESRSIREIRDTLNLSANTVRSALASAIARLHHEWRARGWDHVTLPARQYEARQRMVKAPRHPVTADAHGQRRHRYRNWRS